MLKYFHNFETYNKINPIYKDKSSLLKKGPKLIIK